MKGMFVLALLLGVLFSRVALAQDAAAGKSLFVSKCSICHGPDGKGNTSMGKSLKIADLHSATVQKMSDAEIKDLILNGKNKMPAFKGKLTDAQMDEVLAYIRELGK
jgi:mono/diheme cytochrome c family protein